MGTLCQAFAVSPILAAVWCSTIAVIADQGLNGLDLERPEWGCLSSSLMISLGAGLVLKELKALSSAAAPATVTDLGSPSVGASKPASIMKAAYAVSVSSPRSASAPKRVRA